MPVVPTTPEVLKALANYNQSQNAANLIPWTLRNLSTGWPLLQVTLYSVQTTTPETLYEAALGGGDCHFFYMSGLSFANLVAQISGKTALSSPRASNLDKSLLQAENVFLFLDGFLFRHEKLSFSMNFSSGTHGKNLTIKLLDYDTDDLQTAIKQAFNFSKKSSSQLKAFDKRYEELQYTERQIQKEINQEVATLINGQVYVDLLSLLSQYVKNTSIIDFFKRVFKVEEFQDFIERSAIPIPLPNLDISPPSPVGRRQTTSSRSCIIINSARNSNDGAKENSSKGHSFTPPLTPPNVPNLIKEDKKLIYSRSRLIVNSCRNSNHGSEGSAGDVNENTNSLNNSSFFAHTMHQAVLKIVEKQIVSQSNANIF